MGWRVGRRAGLATVEETKHYAGMVSFGVDAGPIQPGEIILNDQSRARGLAVLLLSLAGEEPSFRRIRTLVRRAMRETTVELSCSWGAVCALRGELLLHGTLTREDIEAILRNVSTASLSAYVRRREGLPSLDDVLTEIRQIPVSRAVSIG
jgi:hypothetical protein